MKFVRAASLLALASVPSLPAMAQTEDRWTGEGAFNAGVTSGNTETTDLGVALKVKHEGDQWKQAAEFAGDYGKTDDVESKNRLFAAGQIDRTFNEQWAGYGRLTWERDEFSGFENRYFAGLGLAFKAIDSDAMKWTLEGGPGYKVDEIRETLTTPAATEETIGARLGSKVSNKLNDAVTFSNDSEVVYAQTSTQLINVTALTATLWDNLSARFSFDVRHDTDPLPGFEATDTATKVSLVYKVG